MLITKTNKSQLSSAEQNLDYPIAYTADQPFIFYVPECTSQQVVERQDCEFKLTEITGIGWLFTLISICRHLFMNVRGKPFEFLFTQRGFKFSGIVCFDSGVTSGIAHFSRDPVSSSNDSSNGRSKKLQTLDSSARESASKSS